MTPYETAAELLRDRCKWAMVCASRYRAELTGAPMVGDPDAIRDHIDARRAATPMDLLRTRLDLSREADAALWLYEAMGKLVQIA